MCLCRLIHCNKHTAVVGNTDKGGAVRGEEYERSLCLSLNFALNLKLLWNKVYLKHFKNCWFFNFLLIKSSNTPTGIKPMCLKIHYKEHMLFYKAILFIILFIKALRMNRYWWGRKPVSSFLFNVSSLTTLVFFQFFFFKDSL